MKKLFLCAVIGILTAGICGCQNTVNTVENADKTMTPNVVNDKRFVTDGYLKDRLQMTGVTTHETDGGLLQVQVAAVNTRTGFFSQIWSGITGENPYKVNYKFTWFDVNGMAVDSSLSLWQTIEVIPGEAVYFRSVAPTKACKDFMLNLREAN